MNKKVLIIIISLIVVYISVVFIYLKSDNNTYDYSSFKNQTTTSDTSTSISTTTKVQSVLSENVDLHTTYYLGKLYVEENEQISEGTKILKYKNGKYLRAPYDCVITSINLPKTSKQITNEHYIQISSVNSLKLEINVAESKISSINIGSKASITIRALDNKEYIGYVTSIGNIASNKKFKVVIEFQNDGQIMLGMSANVEL